MTRELAESFGFIQFFILVRIQSEYGEIRTRIIIAILQMFGLGSR